METAWLYIKNLEATMSRKIQRVILLLDTSGSMYGKPIESVKAAVSSLANKVEQFNSLSSRIELQIIAFATEAKYISKNKINDIVACGRTNLADAYKKLNLIFKKHNKFDYPPIILLLCDGKPNICNHEQALQKLYHTTAFRRSLKVAIAYGNQDADTIQVLKDFAGSLENVLQHENISTIRFLIQHSLPRVLKEQAKHDNQCYTPLMKLIKNDAKKYETFKRASKRNSHVIKRNI